MLTVMDTQDLHTGDDMKSPLGVVPSGKGTGRKNSGESKRSNKPLMEKRRRARINNCLNELKMLVLDSMKKDPARHSKLEKADILELTVRHVAALQQRAAAHGLGSPEDELSGDSKFQAGYVRCMSEVSCFLSSEKDSHVKRRVVNHLNATFNTLVSQQGHSGSEDEGHSRTQSVSPALSHTPPPPATSFFFVNPPPAPPVQNSPLNLSRNVRHPDDVRPFLMSSRSPSPGVSSNASSLSPASSYDPHHAQMYDDPWRPW
ncbi:unnamed protein product [Cyprideis torosa]|uniref:Uncharacterized protein n=1 Tax=Cyprideis torosa TaxID=163714 RepID=A0A7R8WBM7_9CRUS|nr:unnamed protein product [Cyprideis torosa]CAG0887129.1 unnamed protein product [Cyprideis torosa]